MELRHTSYRTIIRARGAAFCGDFTIKYSSHKGKLIRVLQGEIFDVAVDLRRESPEFGRWTGHILSSENRRMLWVPPAFAHGFLVLSETAEVAYKATEYYAPQFERTLLWNDPDVGIQWPFLEG